MSLRVENKDGIEFLDSLQSNSVDLILTDPPYIISKNSGMNEHYNRIRENKSQRTEEDWKEYKERKGISSDDQKQMFLEFGSIYGKKYAVKTDYGTWDSEFSMGEMEQFVKLFYEKLKKGGTCIIFFDLWKIETLKNLLEKYKFKQIRLIEWVKTNPQPRNSNLNYLTNCREIALLGVKGSKPTFNSKYDNGIYHYPLQGGKNRFHPTQKNLKLFEDLVRKHSNEGDLVVDTFLGSGTTAIACKNTNRRFAGCEISTEYHLKILELLQL